VNRARPARETMARWSRREFLAFGWLPFFRPRHISLAGARFRIVRRGHSNRRYLLIHGNEETARTVLTEFLQAQPGIAYLIETHTRNVKIDSGELDPNRMFSRVGAEANLKMLNPGWTTQQVDHALAILDRGRDHLVRALLAPDHGLTLALHNNSPDYSVQDEVPVSDSVSLKESANPHAFFLCTQAADFEILSQSPFNVVLQHDKPSADDGSLSHLAALRGARYLNLEVRLGDRDKQREMLLWAARNLP